MRAIFISYRREDAEGEAGRLFDDLVGVFGEHSVFMDVAAIEVGRDFRKAIDESVATCGVLLAIIGKGWVEAKDEAGQRRLDNPSDFVRLETASALKRDIPVIPVLVHGAKMPRVEQLPDDLKELAYRNGVELTHARWGSDVQLLIKALRPHVEERKVAPAAPIQAVGEDAAVKTAPAPAEIPAPALVVSTTPRLGVEPASPSKKPFVLILAGAAAVLVVGAVVAYRMMPHQVTVPDLTGTSLPEATAKLQALKLAVGSQTQQFAPDKEPNTVLAQTPAANQRLSKGTKVDLVLSPPAVAVPDVVGKSLETAKKILQDSQLVVGEVDKEAKDGVARNTVLDEFPPPGTSARAGSKVALRVADASPVTSQSSQPELISVPSLLNRPYREAESALRDAGLAVGKVASEERSDVPRGTVTQQSPKAGAKVQSGTRVYLTVSEPQAVKTVSVPSLIKRSLNEATALLQAQGLAIGQVKREARGDVPADTVLDQSPGSRQQVSPGSKVDVTLAAGPPTLPKNPLVGDWVNADSVTRGITRIRIGYVPSSDAWMVHAWGACSPSDCDWGVSKNTKLVKGALVVYWDQGFVNRRMAINLDGERLRMNMESVYKDSRPRQNSQEYFVRR